MASVGKILAGTALLVIGVSGALWLMDSPPDKPNILVLMVDDLGFNDLAINTNNLDIDTPNMDQLAREGVRFTRHYASPVCSPARAAFLTGMYPERLGYVPNGLGISPDVITLPERLREEGYTTWHIGKWHIGDLERTAWPDHQGFDHWFGFLNQWRLAGERVDGEVQMAKPRYNTPWLEGDAEPGRFFAGHLEDILTDKAIETITSLQEASTPWFLNLWFYAPHAPVQPAEDFAKRYPDTPDGRYRALVNQLDTNIGRIIEHLQNLGALDNTIVVVVSDNGGARWASNLPYVGKKGRLDEGALRTPLIIRWADNLPGGKVYSDTVSIEDIYPSLMAAIGAPAPDNLDGDSFFERLSKPGPPVQKARFRETSNSSFGVLSADGRWRLFRPQTILGVEFAPRLFDLAQDPHGASELQPAPTAQVEELVDDYKAWYREVHTVRTDFVADTRGGGLLRGMDFLRTPGFGGYTFGIGLPGAYQGQIASQEGVWSLRRDGDTLVATLAGAVLSGELPDPGACHSIVISGEFWRKVGSRSGADHAALALYVDGKKVDSLKQELTFSGADPLVPTVIGDPHGVQQSVPLPPPVILNTRLDTTTPWTLEAFSRALCERP